jgi:hypothetical protein
MTRLQKAIALRDRLVPWLTINGKIETVGNNRASCRAVTADLGDFGFMYRTPFNPAPWMEPVPKNHLEAVLLQQTGPLDLGYGLDVWYRNAKVMNLQWSTEGRTHLCGFRGGPWEEVLSSFLA